jgi:tetratricopeptide (TPR) repeat protein
MMQQAQAMMANMTPEQIASMQQMVQNMSPEQRANMERMAQQQMGMGGASAASGQAQYQLGGARMLKDEGNTLHKAGKHTEALAKYEKAISNVSAFNSADAAELKTICELNKAMCHLKLEQWKPCEQVCSTVLLSAPLLVTEHFEKAEAKLQPILTHL